MGGILGTVLGGIGHVFSGGVLGVVGSIATGILDHFTKKKELEKEIAAINAQKELAIQKANGDALLETLKMQNAATSASYEHDTKMFGKDAGAVDIFRGTLRPIMCYLLFLTAAGITIYSIVRVGLDASVMSECAKYGVYTCMDLATIVVTWYFGSRQMEKIKRK